MGGPCSYQPRKTLEEGEQVSVRVRGKGKGPTTGGGRPGQNARLRQPYWLGRCHMSTDSVPHVWGTESAERGLAKGWMHRSRAERSS